MKIAIVINPSRLTDELKAILDSHELTKKYDIDYDLFIPAPADLENTLNQLNYATYNACLIGGGDGTVRTAAEVLKCHDLPMIILPLGTFNVLAKSMDYPNDIDEIFNIIKNKKIKEIDLAEVNGKVFLNHAWLGFYYVIMKAREKHKNILGKSRLLKAIFNAFLMFKRIPMYEFQIKVDDIIKNYRTCLIFISNNESSSEIFNFGVRSLLATGLLQVAILSCHTRRQLLVCMVAIIFTNFKNTKYVTHFAVEELKINQLNDESNLVLDGELLKLRSPLHFINHKNKLKMIAR